MIGKKRIVTYGLVGAGVILLLVLGGIYDKTISDAIYQPRNVMAVLFEGVGIFPPFLFVSAAFAALFYLIDREKKNGRLFTVLCAVCAVLPYLLFGYMAAKPYASLVWVRLLVAVGAGALLTPLTFLFFRKKERESLKKFFLFLLFAAIVSLLSTGIINVVKFLWGRVRYRQMIADEDFLLTAFTPWYRPRGFSLTHHSFPSGHTCSAANLLVLCAFDEVFEGDPFRKKVVCFTVGLYILVMAYSRIILGAHFLSDVTMGFAIGFLTYAVVRYLYFDKSKRVIAAIMQINREKELRESGEEPEGEPQAELPPEEIEISEDGQTTEEEVISRSIKVIETEEEEEEERTKEIVP